MRGSCIGNSCPLTCSANCSEPLPIRWEARAVPSEKSVELGELAERWTKGG